MIKHSEESILFENVKGTPFPCVSNLFGTSERTKYIFRELLRYSYKHQFIFPAYSTAQKIISQILTSEENRIFDLLERLSDSELEYKIDALFSITA